MRIAFDVGGVISRYPEEMKRVMQALVIGGVDVRIITDMSPTDAWSVCVDNDLTAIVSREKVHCADWVAHGDMCKSKLMKELEIDILIDDRPDYCASGDFIGLVLSPRPRRPYFSPKWLSGGTPTVMVPAEELKAFQEWRTGKRMGEI